MACLITGWIQTDETYLVICVDMCLNFAVVGCQNLVSRLKMERMNHSVEMVN